MLSFSVHDFLVNPCLFIVHTCEPGEGLSTSQKREISLK